MKWRWRVALAIALLTGPLVLTEAVLALLVPTRSTISLALVFGGAAALAAALGTVIAYRVRGNAVGPLLACVGLTLAFTATREIGWIVLARHPDEMASLAWLVAVLAESSVWLLVALALLLLVFPDGHRPGPGWRMVPALLIGSAIVVQAYGAVDPAPFRPPLKQVPRPFARPPAAFDVLYVIAELTVLALLVACAASLVVRFHNGDERCRQQLKWVALAGLGVPGFVLVCLSEVLLLGHAGWASLAVGAATIVGLPSAIAVAMLRYDLFDIDRAFATITAYVIATSVLLVIFVTTSLTAGLLLAHDSAAVAAATTALAAVALSPLRRRLQRQIDRRLYPRRQAAFMAIDSLQHDIRTGTAQPEQLEERLRAALRDPDLRVGYLSPEGTHLVDGSGRPMTATGSIAVMTGNTRVGGILTTSPWLTQGLLREVAAASAPLVELVRLRLELSAALREVQASRTRLVRHGDRERRRLERDLHDGAQQRLISLGMELRVAQRHLDDGTTDVTDLIDQVVAELGTAVAELRQIAHGLRPSSLDDGLQAALVGLTQHTPVPVSLRIHPDPLPDDLTTTVYYVASEAITNAVKHADASRIDVCVARCDGRVEVQVSDDGAGGAQLSVGSGLAGLADRVNAMGGVFALDSPPGRGTTVQAVLPCAS